MDSQKVRELLGQLQENPLQPDVWTALDGAARNVDGNLSREDCLNLLAAARAQHAERQEWTAVCSLLETEVAVAEGTPRAHALLAELARVFQQEMTDEQSAGRVFQRMLEDGSNDGLAETALRESGERGRKWKDMVKTYLSEADNAPDDVYRASMMMRAAEMELRFAGEECDKARVLQRLSSAVERHPGNEAALRMLEQLHRLEGNLEGLRSVLEMWLANGESKGGRVAAGIRLARVGKFLIDDPQLAIDAYRTVLTIDPRNSEAIENLQQEYSSAERWDDLVALYEAALGGVDLRKPAAMGDLLQVAMLHYRMRKDFSAAQAWFEHVRKLDPTNVGMLGFYRDLAEQTGDEGMLLGVLQAAQRALPDGEKKQQISVEIARLAEGQKDAQQAIDQYKSVLRQDPTNVEAREALKKLYRRTQGYNQLVEVLRSELEQVPADDVGARSAVLQEIASVYRDHVKSETALVSALNQILQVDETNVSAVRELISLYEKLGRWRDLLSNQQRLADLTDDAAEKVELLRATGRRWLDQFSNVQNATAAFEALLAVQPRDSEARDQLRELYKKRRAWPAMFALLETELASLEGGDRVPLLSEMAELAAERLHQPEKAIELMKEVLALDPAHEEIASALEKQAERGKDWVTLADVLEKKAATASDEPTKLALLQKLGAVYSDHLQDVERSSDAWRRVLALEPGHSRALRVLRETFLKAGDYDQLEDLYASQRDWEGLADVLSNAADKESDVQAKVEMSYRAAAVYEGKLGQPDRAFRSYERILAVTPGDTKAAAALVPLYEADEKWSRLPALYELLAAKADDIDEKLSYLHRLADSALTRLNDKASAFEYARQAFVAAPRMDGALARFEAACVSAGAWEAFTDTLASIASASVPEPESGPGGKKRKKKGRKAAAEPAPDSDAFRRSLLLTLSRGYSDSLGRATDAIAILKSLLEASPGDYEVGEQLEALLRREGRREELRWLLELRVQHAASDTRRADLLSDWASLEEHVFEEALAAADIYRRVVALDPGRPAAVRALPRLLLAAGEAVAAADVLEEQRANVAGDDRVELELQLAELYSGQLGRPEDALDACVAALQLTSGLPRAVAILRTLLEVEQTRGRAAQILADEFAHGNDAREEASAVSAMLSAESEPERRRALYERLVDIQQQKLQLNSAALDVVLRAVVEFPRDLALWDRAAELSAETGRLTELADAFRDVLRGKLDDELMNELCKRAAALHEQFGDPVGATPYLERVLRKDPTNADAFNRMKQVFTNTERWGELSQLFESTAEALEDPVRKVDVYAEAALVAEDILEDPAKATRYYEAILGIEADHAAAAQALDRLYTLAGRHEDLANLLTRRLESADEEELVELKTRLAKILLEQLHRPAAAADHLEDVLARSVGDYAARELAESLLEIGSQRVRAARMLEPVYEERDEIRQLVGVLRVRLDSLATADPESEEGDERRRLLRRVAELTDDRLKDDQGAFVALSQYLPLDPIDVDARARLTEVGMRLGRFQELAAVLEQTAEHCSTPTVKADIIMELARLYSDQLGDDARAEQCYKAALELDPSDADMSLPAARALEAIYLASGRFAELAKMLDVQIRLEVEPVTRRELLARLGALREAELGDVKGAVSAWRQRLDDDPTDEDALAALDRLYERAESWERLVEILQQRQDRAESPEDRKQLMRRLALVYGDKLSLGDEAIETWRAISDEFGLDVEVFDALTMLYTAAGRWEELAYAYDAHLETNTDPVRRLDLLTALGELRESNLQNPGRALEAYRTVLTENPSHERARAALRGLLTCEDTITRREAAEVLGPIYEAEAAYEPLLEVLRIEVECTDDPLLKLEGLQRAARVAENNLNDLEKAFSFVCQAVSFAAGHTDLRPWLDELDRLSAAVDGRGRQVKLLRDVVQDIFDGDVQFEVTTKIATLARDQLGDVDLALEYFRKALDARLDSIEALTALEAIYEQRESWRELHDVVQRHIDVVDTEEERLPLRYRRADLLAQELDDKEGAIEAYTNILDSGLEERATTALEALYTALERWEELVELYQRQLDETPTAAVELRVKIASVAMSRLGEPARALDDLEAALDADSQNEGAIAAVEKTLEAKADPETRIRAANLLEPIYMSRADYDRVIFVLREHIDATEDPSDRAELLQRLARLFEEQKEDYKAALKTYAILLHDDITDESTVEELERIANVADAGRDLANIYATELDRIETDETATFNLSRRAGELFRQHGDPLRSLHYFRRALAFEPENRELFDAVDRLLTETDRAADRVEHYRAGLETRYDAEERLSLLHAIAGLQAGELSDYDAAIATYREALEVDTADTVSLDALGTLYERKQRHDDLAELYLQRAETTLDPQESAAFRLALARLYRSKLERPADAVDQLEEIVSALPSHAEAIAELEQLKSNDGLRGRVVDVLRPLYESADDWQHLVALNEDRLELATDPLERVAIWRETGRLWEERGGDFDKARAAYGAAVRIDADDPAARDDFERLCARGESWDELADLYEAALEEKPDLAEKRDILARLAEVHDTRRDDPRKALDAYDRLRQADETDLAPVEKMEEIATLLSDWATLVVALSAKADLVLDDEERASLWRRVGEAHRDMLESPELAIRAYEKALDLEPSSAWTIDNLIGLYEKSKNHQRLAELYQQRVDLADEDETDLVYDLLIALAKIHEQEFDDRPSAIEALTRALSVREGDAAALGGLNRLYRQERMWHELLDNLRLQASMATDAAGRIACRREVAQIQAEELQNVEDAVESYRTVLDEAPDDVQTITAVKALGESHEHLREAVSSILVPVLRANESYALLTEVLEMQLTVQDLPDDRAATLRTIAEVYAMHLGEKKKALGALLRALAEDPDAIELHNEIQTLADDTDSYAEYADVLSERAQNTFDAEQAAFLYNKLGLIAEFKLLELDRAIAAHVAALEQAGDRQEQLQALDRLYGKSGNKRALLDVLERLTAMVAESEQADLYARIADLELNSFNEPGQALAALRMSLERAPDHKMALEMVERLTEERDLFEEAAEILEASYRSMGQTGSLALLYEKRTVFANSPEERLQMRRDLARVLEEEVGDAGAAQRVLQLGVADDPSDAAVIDELHRLATATGDWRGAAEALLAAVTQHEAAAPDLKLDLAVRAGAWYRDNAGDAHAAESAFQRALELSPNNDDVLVQVEALQRQPGRELALAATLRSRARLKYDEAEKETLYREAKALADSRGDQRLAEEMVRELLRDDEGSLWALGELTEICSERGDHQETLDLLGKRIERTVDPQELRALRMRAADVARSKLGNDGAAIDLYQQLFDDEPTDRAVGVALREMYTSEERWEDLSSLMERLVDVADAAQERGDLRMDLARLNVERFDSPETALDLLRTVLDDEPGRADAVVALSQLLERLDRFEELADLLESQIAAAAERGDTEGELAFRVRLGEVCETSLGDRGRAIEAYHGVLARDEAHRGALEALVRLHKAAEQYAEGAEILERLVSIVPRGEALDLALDLAEQYRQAKDLSGAARALERAREVDRTNQTVVRELRELYEATEAWSSLVRLITSEVEETEDVDRQVSFLRQAAQVALEKSEDHGTAAQLLERASQIKPDDRDLLLELCDAYSASGRGPDAVAALQKVVESYGGKRNKELADIHRRLAKAYLADGNTSEAQEELDKAFRMQPGNIAVLKELGNVAYQNRDFKKAQQMFRALLLQKLDASSPISKAEVFFHLGRVHRELDEKPKAIQMLERALQTDGSLSQAKDLLAELKG